MSLVMFVLGVSLYIFLGIVIGKAAVPIYKKNCGKANHRNCGEHGEEAGWTGVFWPVAIPLALVIRAGVVVGDKAKQKF